ACVDAGPVSRVRRRPAGARAANPAPSRHHELLRGVGARRCRRHRHTVARRGAGSEEPSRHVRTSMRGSRPGDLGFPAPSVIARLATLGLRARTIVEGFLSGLHRSPLKGFSVEFAEYRQYLPGDDLTTIDWKVFARSDRFYVKKYEE